MKKIFACSAAFAVALLIHIPLVSSAAENDSIPIANSSQEVLSNGIVQYIDKSDNHYFFNSYKANMSNASPDVIEAGPTLMKCSRLFSRQENDLRCLFTVTGAALVMEK